MDELYPLTSADLFNECAVCSVTRNTLCHPMNDIAALSSVRSSSNKADLRG